MPRGGLHLGPRLVDAVLIFTWLQGRSPREGSVSAELS